MVTERDRFRIKATEIMQAAGFDCWEKHKDDFVVIGCCRNEIFRREAPSGHYGVVHVMCNERELRDDIEMLAIAKAEQAIMLYERKTAEHAD